jgi:hypothetical protein
MEGTAVEFVCRQEDPSHSNQMLQQWPLTQASAPALTTPLFPAYR